MVSTAGLAAAALLGTSAEARSTYAAVRKPAPPQRPLTTHPGLERGTSDFFLSALDARNHIERRAGAALHGLGGKLPQRVPTVRPRTAPLSEQIAAATGVAGGAADVPSYMQPSSASATRAGASHAWRRSAASVALAKQREAEGDAPESVGVRIPHRALLRLDRERALSPAGATPEAHLHLPRRLRPGEERPHGRARATAVGGSRSPSPAAPASPPTAPQPEPAPRPASAAAALARAADASTADPLDSLHWREFNAATAARLAAADRSPRGRMRAAAVAAARAAAAGGDEPADDDADDEDRPPYPPPPDTVWRRLPGARWRLIAIRAEGWAAIDVAHAAAARAARAADLPPGREGAAKVAAAAAAVRALQPDSSPSPRGRGRERAAAAAPARGGARGGAGTTITLATVPAVSSTAAPRPSTAPPASGAAAAAAQPAPAAAAIAGPRSGFLSRTRVDRGDAAASEAFTQAASAKRHAKSATPMKWLQSADDITRAGQTVAAGSARETRTWGTGGGEGAGARRNAGVRRARRGPPPVRALQGRVDPKMAAERRATVGGAVAVPPPVVRYGALHLTGPCTDDDWLAHVRCVTAVAELTGVRPTHVDEPAGPEQAEQLRRAERAAGARHRAAMKKGRAGPAGAATASPAAGGAPSASPAAAAAAASPLPPARAGWHAPPAAEAERSAEQQPRATDGTTDEPGTPVPLGPPASAAVDAPGLGSRSSSQRMHPDKSPEAEPSRQSLDEPSGSLGNSLRASPSELMEWLEAAAREDDADDERAAELLPHAAALLGVVHDDDDDAEHTQH